MINFSTKTIKNIMRFLTKTLLNLKKQSAFIAYDWLIQVDNSLFYDLSHNFVHQTFTTHGDIIGHLSIEALLRQVNVTY